MFFKFSWQVNDRRTKTKEIDVICMRQNESKQRSDENVQNEGNKQRKGSGEYGRRRTPDGYQYTQHMGSSTPYIRISQLRSQNDKHQTIPSSFSGLETSPRLGDSRTSIAKVLHQGKPSKVQETRRAKLSRRCELRCQHQAWNR